jgi:hypothetical protein
VNWVARSRLTSFRPVLSPRCSISTFFKSVTAARIEVRLRIRKRFLLCPSRARQHLMLSSFLQQNGNPPPALQSHFNRQLVLKEKIGRLQGDQSSNRQCFSAARTGIGRPALPAGADVQPDLANPRLSTSWETKHQHVYLYTNMLRISSLFLVDMKGSSSQLKRLALFKFLTMDLKYSKCTLHSSDFLYFWGLHTPPKYPHTLHYPSRKTST